MKYTLICCHVYHLCFTSSSSHSPCVISPFVRLEIYRKNLSYMRTHDLPIYFKQITNYCVQFDANKYKRNRLRQRQSSWLWTPFLLQKRKKKKTKSIFKQQKFDSFPIVLTYELKWDNVGYLNSWTLLFGTKTRF